MLERLPEVGLLLQGQECIHDLRIETCSALLSGQGSGRRWPTETKCHLERLCGMENARRQGYLGTLEAIRQALAVPVLPLEAEGALDILREAESPCEQLRDFTMAPH